MKYRVPPLEIKTLGIFVTGCVTCPFRESVNPPDIDWRGKDLPRIYTCRLTGREMGEYPFVTGAWETCPLKVSPATVCLADQESPSAGDLGRAVHGDKCHRCIDYRPGNKCAHATCEHPETANPPDLSGLAARTSRA